MRKKRTQGSVRGAPGNGCPYLDTSEISTTISANTKYETARAEVLHRMSLRDQSLMLYFGAVEAIFAITFASDGDRSVLAVIPLLSIGAAHLMSHHSVALAALVAYCRRQFPSDPSSDEPRHWDISYYAWMLDHKPLLSRSFGEVFLLIAPSAAVAPFLSEWYLFLAPLIGIIWTVILIYSTFRERSKILRKSWEIPKPAEPDPEPTEKEAGT